MRQIRNKTKYYGKKAEMLQLYAEKIGAVVTDGKTDIVVTDNLDVYDKNNDTFCYSQRVLEGG